VHARGFIAEGAKVVIADVARQEGSAPQRARRPLDLFVAPTRRPLSTDSEFIADGGVLLVPGGAV